MCYCCMAIEKDNKLGDLSQINPYDIFYLSEILEI
jgi:hypothetical protein